ncbi:MAG: WecB/TagA/CpsF family glycosyltransferase [Rhizobiaceae bacterium]
MNVRAASPATPMPPTRDIMGVATAVLDEPGAIALFAGLISERRFTKVAFLNAYVSNVSKADRAFADTLARFLVLADGVGVDIASKLLYGQPFPANLNGTDLVPALLRTLPGRLKIGLVGAKRENIEAACDRFARLAPQHQFYLISDGYFFSAGEQQIFADLREIRPDILLVAMGVPRQEFWIDGLTKDQATIVVGVGALFDFISGAVPRAPQWMRRARLEWLFRLILEPGRLWQRYVVGNPLFLWHLMQQWWTWRRQRS